MKRKYMFLAAIYLLIGVFTLQRNIESKTIVRPLPLNPAVSLKGDSIPGDYLAKLPEIQKNGGVIPESIRNADVTTYITEFYRGWPAMIQREVRYHYEIVNPAADISQTLSGFHSSKGINFWRLLSNFASVFAVAILSHFAFLLFMRSMNGRGRFDGPRTAHKALNPSGASSGF